MKTQTTILNNALDNSGDPIELEMDIIMTDHEMYKMENKSLFNHFCKDITEEEIEEDDFPCEEYVVGKVVATIYQDGYTADAISEEGYLLYFNAEKTLTRKSKNSYDFFVYSRKEVLELPGMVLSFARKDGTSLEDYEEIKELVFNNAKDLVRLAKVMASVHFEYWADDFFVGIPCCGKFFSDMAEVIIPGKRISHKKTSEQLFHVSTWVENQEFYF